MKARWSLWYQVVLTLARGIFWLLGGIRRVHLDRVPKTGPLLIAPAHFSHLDPPVMACALHRQAFFMAKEELFRNALFGRFIRSIQAFPVRRGENDTEAIKHAIGLLQGGNAVLVFPEGTRGDGETLGSISPGIAMLAKRSGAVVLPVGIVGTHLMLPRGQKKLRRGRITIVYGEPFTYEQMALEGLNEKEIRTAFVAELAERIAGACREGGLDLRTAQKPLGRASSDSAGTAIATTDSEPA